MATLSRILVVAAIALFLIQSFAQAKRNRGHFSFRYMPLPVCPEKAACAEVNAVASSGNEVTPSLMTSFICKCPKDQECPTHPGTHTMHITSGRWYSMCKPICSFKKCRRGEVAEEVLINAKDFGDKTYTKINCLCPGHENSDMSDEDTATRFSGSKTEDPRASTVFQRRCTSYHVSGKRSEYESDMEELEKRMSLENALFKRWN